MQDTAVPAGTVCADDADHVWEPVGNCTHGFGGRVMFEAFRCRTCGQGGHRNRGGYACPRRAEKAPEKAARIERQIAACPVWDAMPADWQDKLRG